jgi:hypothetical protein
MSARSEICPLGLETRLIHVSSDPILCLSVDTTDQPSSYGVSVVADRHENTQMLIMKSPPHDDKVDDDDGSRPDNEIQSSRFP